MEHVLGLPVLIADLPGADVPAWGMVVMAAPVNRICPLPKASTEMYT